VTRPQSVEPAVALRYRVMCFVKVQLCHGKSENGGKSSSPIPDHQISHFWLIFFVDSCGL
jgi:hypothetical protein